MPSYFIPTLIWSCFVSSTLRKVNYFTSPCWGIHTPLIFSKLVESHHRYLRCILCYLKLFMGLGWTYQKVFSFQLVRFLSLSFWLISLVVVEYCPSSYLTYPPLGANFSRAKQCAIQFWKISKKLTWWKSKLLSNGGRLTLLKGTSYFMSLFIGQPVSPNV